MPSYMLINEADRVAGLTTKIVTLMARSAVAAARTCANDSGNASPLVMTTAICNTSVTK